MKKIITLVTAIAAWAGAYNASADTWTVTTIKEFQSRWEQARNLKAGECDTIFVAPANEDMTLGGTYNAKNGKCPNEGRVYVIGVPNAQGDKPILQFNADFDSTRNLTLVFENLHLQQTNGANESSGHILYWNEKNTNLANVDSVIFRNCEISNCPRSIYRAAPKANDKENSICNYFEMSGCTVHNMCITSKNNWPIIYFGQMPIEVVIKNNTFYDMPYVKSMIGFNYINQELGTQECSINFYNNTVLIASPFEGEFINTANYLSPGSVINVYNNLILYPDWRDAWNIDPDSSMTKLVVGDAIEVNAQYNVTEGYQPFEAGNKTDDPDKEWIFSVIENNFTMAEAELAWDDFFAREKKSFLLAQSEKIFTLGKVVDKENNYALTEEPTCIGNPSLYVEKLPTKADVNIKVNGSRSATVTIMPQKEIYVVGDTITVIADDHNRHNKFLDWSDGETETFRTEILTGDIDLTANFEEDLYELLWDTFNDFPKQEITLPVAADHFANKENPGEYRQRVWRGDSYADTTAVQGRSNKDAFDPAEDVNDTVLYVVALERTALDTIKVKDAETKEAYTGKTTNLKEIPGDCGGEHPTYHRISFSTKGLTGVKVSSKHLFEARSYKKTDVEWSLDDNEYKDLNAPIVIDSVAGDWKTTNVELPKEAENQEIVYVRWIGDPTQPIIGGGMEGTDSKATPQLRKYHTYHFIGDIMVSANESKTPEPELDPEEPDEPDAIENVEADVLAIAQSGNTVTLTNVAAATVELYNTVGARVASVPVIDGTAAVTLPAHGAYIVKAGKAGCIVVY